MDFETGYGLRICAGVFLLPSDKELKEVLFCGLADLVRGSCELLVWSYVWPGPELETDRTGAFADVFF